MIRRSFRFADAVLSPNRNRKFSFPPEDTEQENPQHQGNHQVKIGDAENHPSPTIEGMARRFRLRINGPPGPRQQGGIPEDQ